MALLQAAIAGLVALIITPGLLFYFDVTPKLAILLAGTGVAVLFAGSLRPANRWLSLLLAASAVSLGVSTALSTHPGLSAFGTNWRRFGALPQAAILLFAWLVSQQVAGRKERVVTMLRVITAAGAITAVYGIAQYLGWDPLLPKSAYHIGEGVYQIVRPPGTLSYVSYFATWLVAVTFLAIELARTDENRVWQRAAWAIAAVAAVAMVLTGTRAAMVGLAVGAAIALTRTRLRISWRRVGACAALAVVAAGAFYVSPAGAGMRSRMHWFAEDPWGGARPRLWRDTLRMGGARLLRGFGPETYTAEFAPYESRELARLYPDFSYESPHNILLDALVSQGVGGMLILCAVCALGVRRPGWIAAGVAATAVAQMFTVFMLPTALIFYAMVALAAGRDGPAAPERAFTPNLAPVALGLLFLAFRFTEADRALALAQRDVVSANVESATAHFDQYRRERLPGGTAELWYSRAMLQLAAKAPSPLVAMQAFRQSQTAGLAATRSSEDPFNAWYSMAEIYAAENDARQTEASLRASIAALPNWFKPHWALAQLLQLQSRMGEARQEAALAMELNAGRNPEVVRTFEALRGAAQKQ